MTIYKDIINRRNKNYKIFIRQRVLGRYGRNGKTQ